MRRLGFRTRRVPRAPAGFTLLEILVAVAILGVTLTSLLGLQARNVRLTAEAQQLTIAGMLASRLMADVQADDFPALGSDEGKFVGNENDVSSSFNHVFGGTLGECTFHRGRNIAFAFSAALFCIIIADKLARH